MSKETLRPRTWAELYEHITDPEKEARVALILKQGEQQVSVKLPIVDVASGLGGEVFIVASPPEGWEAALFEEDQEST